MLFDIIAYQSNIQMKLSLFLLKNCVYDIKPRLLIHIHKHKRLQKSKRKIQLISDTKKERNPKSNLSVTFGLDHSRGGILTKFQIVRRGHVHLI